MFLRRIHDCLPCISECTDDNKGASLTIAIAYETLIYFIFLNMFLIKKASVGWLSRDIAKMFRSCRQKSANCWIVAADALKIVLALPQ